MLLVVLKEQSRSAGNKKVMSRLSPDITRIGVGKELISSLVETLLVALLPLPYVSEQQHSVR